MEKTTNGKTQTVLFAANIHHSLKAYHICRTCAHTHHFPVTWGIIADILGALTFDFTSRKWFRNYKPNYKNKTQVVANHNYPVRAMSESHTIAIHMCTFQLNFQKIGKGKRKLTRVSIHRCYANNQSWAHQEQFLPLILQSRAIADEEGATIWHN